MRIGIFGGTFNPVHMGHINASLEFYKRASLSRVFVIPDRIPPHKEGLVVSGEHRMNMLSLAYGEMKDKDIVISDVELLREGRSYTYHTLSYFKENFPDDEIYLYVGSDMYYTLPDWYRGEELFSMCTFAVAPRRDGEKEKIMFFHKVSNTVHLVSGI